MLGLKYALIGTMDNNWQVALEARPMGRLPLSDVLRERESNLADIWDADEAEEQGPTDATRYVEANFELSLRELMCDAAGKLCRGWG